MGNVYSRPLLRSSGTARFANVGYHIFNHTLNVRICRNVKYLLATPLGSHNTCTAQQPQVITYQ
ncbi:MAG: hypothetical protein ACI8QT_000250 [Halioglobus sp.]|jgi:hypothetical protein